MCRPGWYLSKLVNFVEGICTVAPTLDPISQYIVAEQAGITESSRGLELVERIASNSLQKFVEENQAAAELDEITQTDDPDGDNTEVAGPTLSGPAAAADVELSEDDPDDASSSASPEPDQDQPTPTPSLPDVEVKDILDQQGKAIDIAQQFAINGDDGTARRLVARGVHLLWERAIRSNATSVAAETREVFEDASTNHYAREIAQSFLDEYDAAVNLSIPADWRFRPPGSTEVAQPSLMQRRAASLLRDKRRVGNWSGTGAGKTVSAILGAAVSGARTVIVVCPNATVDIWESVIQNCLPNQSVATKTSRPHWKPNASCRWLVLNFEYLQSKDTERVKRLVDLTPDLLVVDEVHFAKRRGGRDATTSARRDSLMTLASMCGPELRVMAMSATPVLNDLTEAFSLLELVTGNDLSDQDARPTVRNSVNVHSRLYEVGLRYMPDYEQTIDVQMVPIPCPELLDEALAVNGTTSKALGFEQVFAPAKIEATVEACLQAKEVGERVLVYTEYVYGIVEPLARALEAAGLKVGAYTGDDKTGLARFLGIDRTGHTERALPESERVDVLVGSSAIGTGVDGLQHVTHRLVFFSIPWTAAGYEQVVGRVYRQGQGRNVEALVLQAYIPDVEDRNGDTIDWSWDSRRWRIIQNKRTLADAAVNGLIPDHLQRRPEAVAQGATTWLNRLRDGQCTVEDVRQYRMVEPPPEQAGAGEKAGRQRWHVLGFSRMNARLNGAHSARTHARLAADPVDWYRYHRLYTEARQSWKTIPANVFADWLDEWPAGQVVADLGCGEMLLANRCQGRHTIRGFDHVAVDDRVTACDISHVPLPDASVDITILSLALMGTNYEDYLVEARRILKPGAGQLWFAETKRRLVEGESAIRQAFGDRGFGVVSVKVTDDERFVLVSATRTIGTPEVVQVPLLTTHSSE